MPTGMITKASELVLGLVIYHIYGHVQGAEPTKEIVVKLPLESKNIHGECLFETQPEDREFPRERFCGDCGLDGADYNSNRIFYDAESAMAYKANLPAHRRSY